MPAAAELASAPGWPRSSTSTLCRACANRQAMELPINPAPMTITSAVRGVSAGELIHASLPPENRARMVLDKIRSFVTPGGNVA